jgi:hypothetical protein
MAWDDQFTGMNNVNLVSAFVMNMPASPEWTCRHYYATSAVAGLLHQVAVCMPCGMADDGQDYQQTQ